MSKTSALRTPASTPLSAPIITAEVRTVALLVSTAFLAVLTYYFVGIDEGAVSVFAKSTLLHEFFHDGRHLLGFPCH